MLIKNKMFRYIVAYKSKECVIIWVRSYFYERERERDVLTAVKKDKLHTYLKEIIVMI